MPECHEKDFIRKRAIFGATTNFIIDVILFVTLVFLITTGLILHVTLPPGSGRIAVLGLSRHQWGDVHFYLSMSFLAGMCLHLWLHWHWIVCMLKGNSSQAGWPTRRAIVLIITITIFLGIMLTPFLFKVDSAERGKEIERGWHGRR
ncbi:MAG: DUF4405 domain-containing protein [Oligoflexia bacterium]|nr:DUF4405 domain-containing protein [Oligoflexia bacterium]